MSVPGTPISDVDTPALLIDLDVMERNLARVADYARTHRLRLRPHTKTHKIPALARMQLDLGAVGLTVAKVSEAEVMLAARPTDLLVAYPVIGPAKLARLTRVACATHVTVALDSLVAAKELSRAAEHAGVTFDVLVEVDVGFGRVGVDPGPAMTDLGRAVMTLPNLRLRGIAFYPGHITVLDANGLAAIDRLSELTATMATEWTSAGLPLEIFSGGSTPTLFHSHRIPAVNEIRPGIYLFNDYNTVLSGACTLNDCAASILATVVSTTRPGRMILDAGSKALSTDRPVVGDAHFGYVIEAPEARLFKLSEEHGFVDVSHCSMRFSVGDRVRVIPNHICTVVNLHDRVYGVRGGRVERIWNVEARGQMQ